MLMPLAWLPSCHQPFLTVVMPLHQSSSFDYFASVQAWRSQSFGSVHGLNQVQHLSNTFIWLARTKLVRLFHLWFQPCFNGLKYIFWYLMNMDMEYLLDILWIDYVLPINRLFNCNFWLLNWYYSILNWLINVKFKFWKFLHASHDLLSIV